MFNQILRKALPVLSFVLSMVLCLFVSACSTRDIYVQELEARGHLFAPPLFVTDSTAPGKFRIIPTISAGRSTTLEGVVERHTNVNANGIYQLDTTYYGNGITLRETPGANRFIYQGKNFRWSVPDLVFGIDGDIALSKSFSLAFGIQYSAQESERFWGWNFGFGSHSTGQVIAIRWDGGVHWTPATYDALTVVVSNNSIGNSPDDVAVFHDRGKESHFGFYSSVSANSRRHDWPLNFLLSFGVTSQRVTNYELQNYVVHTSVFIADVRVSVRATFLHAAIAAIVSPVPSQRLLFGVRWTTGTDVVDAASLIAPFVRFEILP